MKSRPFLTHDDLAYDVLLKWQAVGVSCVLDKDEQDFDIIAWSGQEPVIVPSDALDELGACHDEILALLQDRQWAREHCERVFWKRFRYTPCEP
jgi:hypothetical protein